MPAVSATQDTINFDFTTTRDFPSTLHILVDDKRPVVGPARVYMPDISNDLETEAAQSLLAMFTDKLGLQYDGDPVSSIYVPIFNKFGSDREVVSIMAAHLYWQTLMTGSLPDADDTVGLVCVLENTCNSQFSYAIDGSRVRFLGQGDLHDEKYDPYMVQTGYGIISEKTHDDDKEGVCRYNVRVYPSVTLEAVHISRTPVIITVVVLLVFLFTSLLFIAYDRLVQRRHAVVNRTAVQSTAVVESLFPSGVRERVSSIYAPTETKKEPELKLESSRLFDINEDVAYDEGELFCKDYDDAPPIADTHDECTIYVGEIVGFSHWSSSRSPGQVFSLLEIIYGYVR